MNLDHLRHVWRTFAGVPPSTADAPLCGAQLTSAYEALRGTNRPDCPECARVAAQLVQVGAARWAETGEVR